MATYTRFRNKKGQFAKKGRGRKREQASRYGTTNRTVSKSYKLKSKSQARRGLRRYKRRK